MPAEGFLQRFHDLAEPSEEARVSAALGVRRALGPSSGAEDAGEDLAYAVRRLVRGVQSSRSCCRQGFSLALAELLVAHPEELRHVLELLKQVTELQEGLKAAEQKERLLGRLCTYAAVFEAGCLGQIFGPQTGRRSGGQQEVAAELGRGLHEIYLARPFLREPAVRMMAHICNELRALGHYSCVPELFAEWSLDEKLRKSNGEVHIPGLALELHAVYEEALQAPGAAAKALAAWPSCVRDGGALLGQPAALRRLVEGIAAALGACGLGEPVPFALRPFCRWLLQAQAGPVAKVWPALDEALFPERAPHVAQARSLRALGELLVQLGAERARGELAAPESLLTGFFEQMSRGLELMLQVLTWPRARTHAAAVFAQSRLLEAVRAPQAQGPAGPGRRGAHGGKDEKEKERPGARSGPPPAWPLGDSARLAVLAALQRHAAFLTLPGTFRRQWQQALLAPLSAPGIQLRCRDLLADQARQGREEEASDGNRCVAQLEQLALHACAPDEVILAVLCRLLTAAYFAPARGQDPDPSRSLREFCALAGIGIAGEGDDIAIPVLIPKAEDPQSRVLWRSRFWSIVTALFRRTLPDMAAKVIAQGADATDHEGEGQTSAAPDSPVVKTMAFIGLLGDGSLMIMRLHEWWDYITEGALSVPAVPAASPKKKRRGGSGLQGAGKSGGLTCVTPLDASDAELRAKCLEYCRGLSDEADGEGSLAPRQRNAICGFLLALSLVLVTSEDAEEKAALRAPIEEALAALSERPASLPSAATPKKRAKAQQQQALALAAIPRIAAELFVDTRGLVKEAARAAWRELGEFTSEETLTGLCGAVRGDQEEEGEAEEEEEPGAGGAAGSAAAAEEGEEEDEDGAAPVQRGAPGAAGAAPGAPADEDDAEELVLEGDALWEQLLDEGGGEGGGSLLAAFAASGLEGAEGGQKPPKWQQRLRRQQEDVARKFQEVDLLEAFLSRFAEKRPVAVQVMQDLYDALLAAGRQAAGRAKEGEAEKAWKGKRRAKSDASARQIHLDLAERISKVLSKTLKKLRSWTRMQEVCHWYSAEEWSSRARSVLAAGSSARVAVMGQRLMDAGASLLHFFCLAHRTSVLGASLSGTRDAGDDDKGWDLAKELLLTSLQDWGGKRECERWCAAVFAAFAVRTPLVLLGLPWLEQIRACRKPFVQRAQLAFVATQLLRCGPGPGPAGAGGGDRGLAEGLAELCVELLEGTLGAGAAAAAGAADAAEAAAFSTAAQRQKLRVEALRGLKAALRAARARPEAAPGLAPGGAAARRAAAAAARLRDALPGRRGEAYQLCLHVLRTLKPAAGAAGRAEGQRAAEPRPEAQPEAAAGRAQKRARPRSDESPAAKRGSQAQGAKGSRGLFEDM